MKLTPEMERRLKREGAILALSNSCGIKTNDPFQDDSVLDFYDAVVEQCAKIAVGVARSVSDGSTDGHRIAESIRSLKTLKE